MRREAVRSKVPLSEEVTLNLYDNGLGQFRYIYSYPGQTPPANVRTWFKLDGKAVRSNTSLAHDLDAIVAFTRGAVRS